MNKYVFRSIVIIELILIIAALIWGFKPQNQSADSGGSGSPDNEEVVAENGQSDGTGSEEQGADTADPTTSDIDKADTATHGIDKADTATSDTATSDADSSVSDAKAGGAESDQDDAPVDVVDAREALKEHPECIALYRKALSQIAYRYGRTKGYYLLEMNGDDIPELMVYDDDSHAGQVDIFTVHDGELVSLGAYGENGKVYLNPDAHILQDDFWMGGGGYHAYFDVLSDKTAFRGAVGLVERAIEKTVSGGETDWDSYTEYFECSQPHDHIYDHDEEIDHQKYDELLSEYSDNRKYERYDVEHYYAYGLEETLQEMLDRITGAAEKSPERETVEKAVASYGSFLNKDSLYEYFKKDPDDEKPVVFKAYLDYLDDDDIPELFVMGSGDDDRSGIGIFTYDPENDRRDQIGDYFACWSGLSYIPRKGVIAGSYRLNNGCYLGVIIQIDENGSHVIKYYYMDDDRNCYEVYRVDEKNSGTVDDIGRINTDIDEKYRVEQNYYFKQRDNLLHDEDEKKLLFNGYDMPVIDR